MALGDVLDERPLGAAHVLDRLSGFRLRQKADEVNGMAGAKRDADLAFRLHAADSGTVSRARVDDNDRWLHGIDRDIGGRNDAHERVIGRALECAAITQDFHREGQNMRRRLGRLRDIGVSPLVQGFHEEDAALRRVPPIFRGRLEHRETLRHHIFLVGLVGRPGVSF